MATFAPRPTEFEYPYWATREAYDVSLENAVNAVEADVTVLEGTVAGHGSRLTATEAKADAAATKTSVDTLTGRVTATELVANAAATKAYADGIKTTADAALPSASFDTRLGTRVKVDNTVGRTASVWDSTNSRWQLVYGDTGWRTITAESDAALYAAFFPTGVTELSALPLRVRRIGSTVFARVAFDKTGAGNLTGAGTLPTGWRPDSSMATAVLASNSSLQQVRVHPQTATGVVYQSPAAVMAVSTALSWQTNDAWPTALPGVAYGTIPNA